MTAEARIARLERQNRILFASLLAIALAFTVAATSSKPIPDLIQARAFHVVGKDGTVLVKIEDSFGARNGLAGTLTTLTAKGQAIVELGATTNGEGMVVTLNGKGQKLVQLGATDAGGGAIITGDATGQTLVALGATVGGGRDRGGERQGADARPAGYDG